VSLRLLPSGIAGTPKCRSPVLVGRSMLASRLLGVLGCVGGLLTFPKQVEGPSGVELKGARNWLVWCLLPFLSCFPQ
jgi:hypothetical protein